MLVFLKSQFSLFDTPVHVATHVRQDGVVIPDHMRIQKKRAPQHHEPHAIGTSTLNTHRPAPKTQTKLDRFIAKHGGVRGLGSVLEHMTAAQQQRLFAEMAKLDGATPEAVAGLFPGLAAAPDKTKTPDLFQPPKPEPKPKAKRAPKAKPAPTVAAAPDNESDQDRSHREWQENYAAVTGDIPGSSAKNIERAIGFASHYISSLQKEAFAGNEHAKNMIGSLNLEIEGLNQELARRKPTAPKAAAPAPKPAEITHDASAPFGVPAGVSKPERIAINNQVIARLEQGGPYTGADRHLLRQYSGNGGCGDSLNEFYTDPDVARAMWTTIGRLGIDHGTALEPSCASGVFLHTAPPGFRVTGVELDPVSAAVATALHSDRHEIHTASLERFATADDRQFDVVIGNPPYGPRGYLAKDDKKYISTAEQYFVDTALEKTAVGGVIALVVPTGILDSSSARSFRETMLCNAEFLGAQRMPNTAFEHSHTEVTTDVIYLRRRPPEVAKALMTVDQDTLQALGVWDDEFLSGSYFTGRGASNILGTMGPGWRSKAGMGEDITVDGSMVGVPQAISEFQSDSVSRKALDLSMQQVLDALPGEDQKARAIAAAGRLPYANTAKAGDTKTVDGVEYILQGDPPRWHRVDEFVQKPAIVDAQDLAAEIDKLFTGQAVDRPALEAGIRAYVAKHGVPADNPDFMLAAMADKKLYRLVGAVNRKGELSDAVLGQAPRKLEAGFDATAEALSLEQNGEFGAAELAERLGKPIEEVEDQLAADSRYATLGPGQWAPMDAYLTGELWPKLDAARAALAAGTGLKDKLTDQAARLEKLIDPKSLDDVDFQINSGFLPLHVVEAYFNWRNNDAPDASKWTRELKPVEITFGDGIYKVVGGSQWGTEKLLDKYLNRTGVRKDDVETIAAWNAGFKEWLCGSSYRDAVEDLYNRKFRGFVAQEYSKAPIDVPGLATDRTVRDWRWDSLRRSLAVGRGIVADDVGLGKTLGGLLLARMAKVQGSAKRPIIVVPKSVLANWYKETQLWFPGSRVLTIGANYSQDKTGEMVGRDDDQTERKRKYHDLQQNDYDFILISEPAFEEIDLNPETKEEYYSQDFWVQRGEALGNTGDKRRKAIKEKFEQHLAQREFQDRTDAIWFDDLNVDMIIGDELHHEKNLYAARARFGESPKFLGGQGLSNRALDFNLKARWVRERNGGKGVHGLTATPTTNSPLEIFSMLSHIAPEAFEKIGVRNSEEFLDRYCEFERDKILSTKGDIEDSLVVSGFKNLDELREIMFRYIDRRTALQVGLKLPERRDTMHLIDMSKAQQAVYAELRELAEANAGKKDATGDSHVFSIMDKMGKAALDLELLGPAHAGASSPKIEAVAKQCAEGVKDGGQIIFCEAVDTHEKIARALVDAGIPRNKIGIINAQVSASALKRLNIAEALNSGKLDVVIGNCVMAEGLNMQVRTADIHEMDVPWNPSAVQQRLGRGIRQGNNREFVRTHAYLTKGSFDGYRYQSVRAKRDWMDLLWNGGDRVENLARDSKPTADEMRIMLSADPEAARAEFDKDKTEAVKRFEAGARTDAQKQFVRFQDLTRSYGALGNKETLSARRLRAKIESAKTSLFNNKYWPAKAALDSATDVLIHPQTGTTLTAGTGLDFATDGKMVVTGVNMRAGTVTMRRYADMSGGHPVTLPMAELADAKPYAFDAKAEADEANAKFEAAAAENLSSLKAWDDVKALPSSVIEKNADLIQAQIKAGTKTYKFSMPYGDVPMVNKETGRIEVVESYSHKDKHATHDYLLPTDTAKEQAIQAWIDARRSASIGSRTESGGNRRSQKSWSVAARKYNGAKYSENHKNPLTAVLNGMSPAGSHSYNVTGPLVREAKARLATQQMKRIRRATDINDAVAAILPLAKLEGRTEGYGSSTHTAKYPKEALAMLWARARHLGALNQPMNDVLYDEHAPYAVAGHRDKSVHNALLGMALASGHQDLAEAMVESSGRHNKDNKPSETVRVLGQGFPNSRRHLQQMLRHAEAAGMADQPLWNLREHKLGGLFSASDGYGGYGRSTKANTNLRDVIADRLETAQ